MVRFVETQQTLSEMVKVHCLKSPKMVELRELIIG